MIQSFNEITALMNKGQFCHSHQGEEYDYSFQVSSDDDTFFFLFDGENRLYKIAYHTENEERSKVLELVSKYAQDKTFDMLYSSLSIQFLSWLKSSEEGAKWLEKNFFDTNLVLLSFKEALKSFKGESFETAINSREIICRCNSIDKKAFEQLFDLYQGRKKSILNTSHCSMVCGSCSTEVNSTFDSLWTKRLDKVLEDFTLFSPMEFNGVDLKLLKVKTLAKGLDTYFSVNKKAENIDKLTEILVNYLGAEVSGELKVSISLRS